MHSPRLIVGIFFSVLSVFLRFLVSEKQGVQRLVFLLIQMPFLACCSKVLLESCQSTIKPQRTWEILPRTQDTLPLTGYKGRRKNNPRWQVQKHVHNCDHFPRLFLTSTSAIFLETCGGLGREGILHSLKHTFSEYYNFIYYGVAF